MVLLAFILSRTYKLFRSVTQSAVNMTIQLITLAKQGMTILCNGVIWFVTALIKLFKKGKE